MDDAKESPRIACVGLAAGLWARLELKYHAWPFRWLAPVHGADERQQLDQAFLSAPPCCLGSWWGEPLRCKISSLADMEREDIVALRVWLARTLLKPTRMHMEGLLSEVKAVVPKAKRSPHAERLAYLSHLPRLVKQHLAQGRLDYRGQ